MPHGSETNCTATGFNRRDFLKGSSVAVAASAVAVTTGNNAIAQKSKQPNVTSGATDFVLNINSKDYKLHLEPRVTLLDALRNDLNLTGAKNVDEVTASGADTVIVDGKPVLASSRLAIECVGQKIETIESLPQGDAVVNGFVKHDAQQCGFCTSGFVMATRAFLQKNPKATLKEIQTGLGGNICRCGTYQGITQCAMEIAQKGGK